MHPSLPCKMKESILSAGFCSRQFFLLIAQVMHYMGKNAREKICAGNVFSLFCTVEKDVSYLRDFRVHEKSRSQSRISVSRGDSRHLPRPQTAVQGEFSAILISARGRFQRTIDSSAQSTSAQSNSAHGRFQRNIGFSAWWISALGKLEHNFDSVT